MAAEPQAIEAATGPVAATGTDMEAATATDMGAGTAAATSSRDDRDRAGGAPGAVPREAPHTFRALSLVGLAWVYQEWETPVASNALCFLLGAVAPLATVGWLLLNG
jgi:hypothetical protein